MKVRRQTCMAVTKRSGVGRRDEQCGKRATKRTAISSHPVCDEHAALAATEGLTFDLGSSRLYTAAGTAIVDL